jgi:hypothetical protein
VDLGDEFVAAIQANRVFARTYLTYGWKYQQRMMRNSVSDAVKAALLFHNFPRYVWVTEFGTFDSFNHINIEDCQIYSHLTVDATSSDYWEGRAIFHAPGVVHRWYHDPKDERNDYAEAESVTLNDVAYRPKIGGQL